MSPIPHAHPESFDVLGETMGAWLAQEARRVEIARAPKPKKGTASVGKPAIDAALARLAEVDVADTLANTAPEKNDTRWEYLVRAARACGAVWSPEVLAALDGRLLGRVLAGRLDDTEDEACIVEEDDDELDGINPIYVRRYPKAARKFLESGHFVASAGPELWLIMRDAKGALMNWNIVVYHIGYEGFEELGSLEGWLSFELERLGR